MPIVFFSCTKSLYLVQSSHLEHFYRFFKSRIPEKPYITRFFLVVPIISLTPTKNICCIFPVSLFSLLSSSNHLLAWFFPLLFLCPSGILLFFYSGSLPHSTFLPSTPFTQCPIPLSFTPLLNLLFKPLSSSPPSWVVDWFWWLVWLSGFLLLCRGFSCVAVVWLSVFYGFPSIPFTQCTFNFLLPLT